MFPNGTALNSEDVGRILNSQSVYEEYGVVLQQYGLTGIVRLSSFQMCSIKYKSNRIRGFFLLTLMDFADGEYRDAERKQHGVVHAGGTRGRARDRPDRHHDVNGVH